MSQKTDNLIKLALVFFVSLLSFSIGTYVGKKYSDNQHKLSLLEPKKDSEQSKGTAEFETESTATPVAAVEKHGEHGATAETPTAEAVPNNNNEKPAALTDTEVAKIAEEFANDEENTEEKIVANTEPQTEKVIGKIPNTTKPLHTISTATAEAHTELQTETHSLPAKTVAATPTKKTEEHKVATVAKATAPTGLPKVNLEEVTPSPNDSSESREPASVPPQQEIVPIHYTVQIGSFPTQGEAEGMTKLLQNKGYKTSFIPAKVNGQTWFRVNVGLFGSIREAQDYKKEFLEKTKMTSAIIQRVQQ